MPIRTPAAIATNTAIMICLLFIVMDVRRKPESCPIISRSPQTPSHPLRSPAPRPAHSNATFCYTAFVWATGENKRAIRGVVGGNGVYQRAETGSRDGEFVLVIRDDKEYTFEVVTPFGAINLALIKPVLRGRIGSKEVCEW